ncbi:MAG: CinA family nicotinamide mononucleotide deamidase-related protein [Candidatus Kapaibacterium sp.]
MYSIALLTIGDEICIGQVVNTNAAWIAEQCTGVGAGVRLHSVVGDERERLLEELDRLTRGHDGVIVTGGLGPTHDDITKSVLCDVLHDELVDDSAVLAYVQAALQRRGRPFTERQRGQALRPSTAEVLPNSVGSAPGLLMRREGCDIIALPGVPREMKAIMTESVLPFIRSRISEGGHDVAVYATLVAAGCTESTLADLIGPPEGFLRGASLAFLPSVNGIRLRIGVRSRSEAEGRERISEIEGILRERAGTFIVGAGSESIGAVAYRELSARHATVAVAESCTGGIIGTLLTETPGSSACFMGGIECYSNASKVRDVGLDERTIETFGAVSRECVSELAVKVRGRFGTDYGVAVSGIAGPDGGTEEKSVGTVWIAVADKDGVEARVHNFGTDRATTRERAASTALVMLIRRVRGESMEERYV